MNFDKESKSCVFVGGWRRGGGEVEFRLEKTRKTIGIRLFFCAHALYKISSSWLKWLSSFNANKMGNGQVRGITLPMFYGIYAKYQNPSSGGYQDIVLTRFFYCYKWQRAITLVKSCQV